MANFQDLNSAMVHLTALTRLVDVRESAHWSPAEKVRFGFELRWCREALAELQAQFDAIALQPSAPAQ